MGREIMNVILKTHKGYLNTDNGIKIVNEKEKATLFEMSKVFKEKEKIYVEKPMIGRITIERV